MWIQAYLQHRTVYSINKYIYVSIDVVIFCEFSEGDGTFSSYRLRYFIDDLVETGSVLHNQL